jgi:DNA mismatch repair protein MutS
MSMYDEYARLSSQYRERHGADTVVLMEVGVFMEAYDVGDGVCADVRSVSEILNISPSRKNRNIPQVSRTNPMFCGFPRVALSKYVPMLLDAGWKAVIALQFKRPPRTSSSSSSASSSFPEIERRVIEVISESTFLDAMSLSSSSGASDGAGAGAGRVAPPLMALYLERQRSGGGLLAGWASLDLMTGRTSAGEPLLTHEHERRRGGRGGMLFARNDPATVLDDVYREVLSVNPREILIVGPAVTLKAAPGFNTTIGATAGVDVDVKVEDDEASAWLERAIRHVAGPQGRRRVGRDPASIYAKPSYQDEVLRKVFSDGDMGLLTPAEYVHMERAPFALTAFVAVLQFAFDHNEAIVARVQRPVVRGVHASGGGGIRSHTTAGGDDMDDDDEEAGPMIMAHDALRQLDVLPKSATGGPSLVEMLDRTKTPLGKRAVRARLTNPTRDVRELARRYDRIDRATTLLFPPGMKGLLPYREGQQQTQGQGQGQGLRAHLSSVGDVERAFRRMSLRRLPPADLAGLVDGIRSAREALVLWDDVKDVKDVKDDVKDVKDAQAAAEQIEWDLTAAVIMTSKDSPLETTIDDMRRNPFRPGQRPTLDELQDQIDAARRLVQSAADALNVVGGVSDHVRVDQNEADGLYLTVTHRRWTAILKARCAAAASSTKGGGDRVDASGDGDDGDGDFSPSSFSHDGGSRLSHPLLGSVFNARLRDLQGRLSKEAGIEFAAFLDAMTVRHTDGARALVRAIEDVDVACSCADVAWSMHHVRPVLAPTTSIVKADGDGQGDDKESSWVRARALRHPIIEMINHREAYVPNDVSLGCDGVRGLLLYGVNAVGKSSTMKAVGLAVLMAQAGFFVAADALELRPFSQILTRIGMHDDLYRGHSTFIVEMTELRAILTRACPSSLVIGDELCAGTEAVSAVSIVGAGLAHLSKMGAAFVFATHLHELTAVPQVRAIPGLRVCHLRVHVDDDGALVLDRRLVDGQGLQTYGLEVCRTLDMGEGFLEDADAIRRHVMGVPKHIVSRKTSRYNANVYMDLCSVCRARPAEETHHIDPQHDADDRGFIGGSSSSNSHRGDVIQTTRDLGAIDDPDSPPRPTGPFHKNRRFNLAPICSECHDALHRSTGDIAAAAVKEKSRRFLDAITKLKCKKKGDQRL